MSEDRFVPKGAVRLVAAMVVFSLVLVTGAVMLDLGPQPKPIPTAEESSQHVLLTFADLDDGGIVVRSDNGEMVLEPNTGGFIRGVMRAFARQRRGLDIGPDSPFVLALMPDTRLIIADPVTQIQMNLRAYGKDNHAAFYALLPLAQPSPSAAVLRNGTSASLAKDAHASPHDGGGAKTVDSTHVRPL